MNDLAAQKAALIDRIHYACLTIASDVAPAPRGYFSTWPAYRLDWYDLEIMGSTRSDEAITRGLISAPKFVPTAKQIDDALPALALLDGISKRHRKVVRLRALQLWYGMHIDADDEDFAQWRGGWRGIGKLAGVSHTTARAFHAQAMSYAFERLLHRDTINTAEVSKISRRA